MGMISQGQIMLHSLKDAKAPTWCQQRGGVRVEGRKQGPRRRSPRAATPLPADIQ